jgi:hypothetical protein
MQVDTVVELWRRSDGSTLKSGVRRRASEAFYVFHVALASGEGYGANGKASRVGIGAE